MRTYLIEPQLLFVPFLTRMLGDAGMQIVASRDDVDGKDISAHDPAAIFVDVDFFERGAPNAICRIRQVARHAAIVAYSDLDDPTFEAACYISGANAIISKRAGLESALKIVRALVPLAPARSRAATA